MSTAVATARPSQALRQRRESQRPGLARMSTAKVATTENGVAKEDAKRHLWTQQDILAKFKGHPPSLRVHLHANHFRINDSQESLAYGSPMKELLQHIRDKTVPHNMLDELYMLNIPFYDNCMIVEVYDHKSGGNDSKKESSSSVDGNKVPFSIHNYNNFITPSPLMPYPQKPAAKPNPKEKGPEARSEKEADKENMPAPGQPASSQKQPAKPKVSTIVLFPTEQSQLVDMRLLATTPAPDMQTYRRNQATGRATGHPPTPLTAVPPTPTFPSGRSPKRQKMVIDETNVHEFESTVLAYNCPKLYLEPTQNLEQSVALIEAMTHPNNKNPPPPRKSRKRTTAELAADEAEAADMQRFMLAGDEGQAAKTDATASGEDGQPAVGGANFRTFSRFKALETIKMHHEEAERRKKEEEAIQAQAKRQLQAEQEAKKRREMEANRQAEQTAAMMQQRQELLRQQQQQQALQQDQAMRAVTQAQQMAGAGTVQQTPQSATQPQFSSPIIRQQTPMATAASPLVPAHASHPMGGTPMVATSSSHGPAGSPPRPLSAVSHQAAAMARSASQQNQSMSRTGTPQMVQGTPVMGSAAVSRNMAATPQPRGNQGSPTGPLQGGTPIMMQTPQAHPGQSITPEQIQHMQAAQMQQRMRVQMQQQGMQMSPGQNMTPQQIAMLKATNYIQQNGLPQGQNSQQYKQMLAQRFFMSQQGQNQQMNMSSQNAGNMPGLQANVPHGQGGMNPNMPNMSLQHNLQQNINQMKAKLLRDRQQVQNNFTPQQIQTGQIPIHLQQQLQQLENAIANKERQLQQLTHGAANMAMGGNQNPAQMQQYQALVQQQRAQQARQQQMLAMQQRQHGMNPNQMPQGMMGNMGMMNNMNMNMQNMGAMQNMGGMNMQNMGGMNMGQIGQMNPQQQQQMRVMMMRQQAQMGAQQHRPQGGDGSGMEWSGV